MPGRGAATLVGAAWSDDRGHCLLVGADQRGSRADDSGERVGILFGE